MSNVRQRFESGASGDDNTPHRHHSVKDDYDEGGEFESTPMVNPDTIKETDTVGEALPEVGTAKNLRSKFQQLEKESAMPKASERRGVTPPRQSKVEYESTPKERLQQYEGKSDAGVFESQPKVKEGIIRYGESLEEEPEIEKGYAKSIVGRYKEIEESRSKVVTREKKELTPDRTGKVEYVSEPRGQSITDYEVKVEAGIFESTPKVEEDVVRADEKPDEILPEAGIAKNLLSKFKQLETEVANRPPPSPLKSTTPDRAGRREFVSGPTRGYLEKYEGKEGPREPVEVVRSDEVREEVMPEVGSAKKQMERFKELEKQSSSPPAPHYRKEFTPPRESSPGKTVAGVLENTPTERLEGVVKSTDVYESELPERGIAKNIANKYKQRIESESSPGSGSPSRGKKEFTPPPEAGVYENVPTQSLVIEQRKAESGVLESSPTSRYDVAREHDPSPEVELPERGYAKNMVSKFRQLETESAKSSSSGSPQRFKEFTPPRDTHGLLSPKSPAGVSEGVHPSELPGQYQQQVTAGVYENQPAARPDLVREADTDWSEGLPAPNTAKSMKQRFQEMENKALKELETPEPVHRKVCTRAATNRLLLI